MADGDDPLREESLRFFAILLVARRGEESPLESLARVVQLYYGEPVDPSLRLNLGFLPIRDAFRKITAEEKEST